MRFRLYNKWYAKSHGYFWLPCPLCGQEFGGHEWKDYDGKLSSIPIEGKTGMSEGICPSCTRAGKGRPPKNIPVLHFNLDEPVTWSIDELPPGGTMQGSIHVGEEES